MVESYFTKAESGALEAHGVNHALGSNEAQAAYLVHSPSCPRRDLNPHDPSGPHGSEPCASAFHHQGIRGAGAGFDTCNSSVIRPPLPLGYPAPERIMGLEPMTPTLARSCSNQLSYIRIRAPSRI